MQIFGLRKIFLAIAIPASILVFFGSQNEAFASEAKQVNWVNTTTLSQPGIPTISKGENSFKPTWAWDASKSQISGTIHYSVQWCKKADFSSCSQNMMYSDSPSFSFDDSNSLANGVWYVRVQALDEYGHKSEYSPVGSVSIHNFAVSTPYSVSAKLDGNIVSLTWNDCPGLIFKVWASETGENGSFNVISQTESYVLNTNLASGSQRFYYLTAIDNWGNESPASAVVRVQTPGFQAKKGGLVEDLASILRPYWESVDFDRNKVEGAKSNDVSDNPVETKDFFDFVPTGYFR